MHPSDISRFKVFAKEFTYEQNFNFAFVLNIQMVTRIKVVPPKMQLVNHSQSDKEL